MFGVTVFLVALLTLQVSADFNLKKPESGQTFSGSGGSVSIDITWSDDSDSSDDDFSLANAKDYTVSLCAGTNGNIKCFNAIQKATPINKATKYTAKIPSSTCADGFYFFQIYTTFPEDQNTIHYSERFELTDMTGNSNSFSSLVTMTGDSPTGQTEFGGANAIDSKSFTLFYTSQTGFWRYAPMQLQPGTDPITNTVWSRKYPTSSTSYFSTVYGKPSIKSTTTPPWSYTITSLHNWATVAPYPTVAYAAKDRVTSASLAPEAKKRRWID